MSNNLTGQVSSSKGDLLHISNSGSGVDGTLRIVYDGAGNATVLSVSNSAISVGNISLSGNTITSTSGALTINSNSGTVNLGTATGSTVVIGQSAGNTTLNGTVSFGGTVSYTNLTISGTGTIGTVAATTLTVGGNALTLAGALTTSGAHACTFTLTADTSVTLPTSGTLVNTAVTTLSSLVSIGTISTGVWAGTTIAAAHGGTGLTSLTSAASSVLAAAQTVVQRKYLNPQNLNGTSSIPLDNTAPQNTEGSQVATLTITPKNSSNRLRIVCSLQVSASVANATLVSSLFQDSTANALCAGVTTIAGSGYSDQLVFIYDMAAGTTSATTFNLRMGTSAGTWYCSAASSFNLGGTLFNGSMFEIVEYTP